MKNRTKSRTFCETPLIVNGVANVVGWRFLIITDTVCMSAKTSVFLTNGDLVILRPDEKVSFMPEGCYVGVQVCDGYVKRCLDLFSPALFEKWKDTEALIIALSNKGAEYRDLISNAKRSTDAYSAEFLLKQTVVGCITEMVRKDKYGQQALPQAVVDALEVMKQPEVLSGNFAAFRKKTGMSESHLAHLFAKYNLEVPSEVFRRTKFSYAKTCLENGEDIDAVAKKIGYSTKGFRKVYCSYFGSVYTK